MFRSKNIIKNNPRKYSKVRLCGIKLYRKNLFKTLDDSFFFRMANHMGLRGLSTNT